MNRLFVDTSAWLAFVNRRDVDHKRTSAALKAFRGRLVTSSHVFDETVTLVRYRTDHATAVRVGSVLLDPVAVDLTRATAEDEVAAWDLFVQRDDQEYSFTDCSSFVLLRRLGITIVASLDDDFRKEGFNVVPLPRGGRTVAARDKTPAACPIRPPPRAAPGSSPRSRSACPRCFFSEFSRARASGIPTS